MLITRSVGAKNGKRLARDQQAELHYSEAKSALPLVNTFTMSSDPVFRTEAIAIWATVVRGGVRTAATVARTEGWIW